jgi:hypothetical protein
VVEPAVSTLPDPTPLEPSPREAGEMLAISLKSFAPPKAIPVIDASVLLGNGQPLLPRLKALPLRPKVAPAPKGFGQQPKPAAAPSPAEPKKAVERATPQPPPAEAKQKAPAVSKPLQPGPTPKSAFVAKPVVAPEATPAPAPEAPKAAQPPPAKKAAGPVDSAKEKPPATPPAGPPKTEPVSKPVAVKSAPAAPAAQPPAAPPPAKIAPPPKNDPPAKAAAVASRSSESTDHTVPNFGAVVNTSMFGSLKVKIGLGALIAVLSIGVYIGATSKSKMSATSARASDGVGPSIMVGEGGWVEGWAGDPVGSHNGRQITIYRPSLKLSDYRFEFQGQIENKSIGWIFRAADPDNYYAMKLELVSPELPLKLALYKYLVLKGRQVQVGRVPIDVPVKSDTVFSIRVDVRGPKFNTYVQGQAVDFWTDDQLRSGGVGFLNERSERGKVKSVALSYLSGGTK